VRENRYYSEDWTFCENWRDLGGKVYVDKRVLLKHTGTYVFDFQSQEKLYKDLQALDQQLQTSKATAPPTPTPDADVEPKVIASSAPKKAASKRSNKKAA